MYSIYVFHLKSCRFVGREPILIYYQVLRIPCCLYSEKYRIWTDFSHFHRKSVQINRCVDFHELKSSLCGLIFHHSVLLETTKQFRFLMDQSSRIFDNNNDRQTCLYIIQDNIISTLSHRQIRKFSIFLFCNNNNCYMQCINNSISQTLNTLFISVIYLNQGESRMLHYKYVFLNMTSQS